MFVNVNLYSSLVDWDGQVVQVDSFIQLDACIAPPHILYPNNRLVVEVWVQITKQVRHSYVSRDFMPLLILLENRNFDVFFIMVDSYQTLH